MHKVRSLIVVVGTLVGYSLFVATHSTGTVIGQFGGIGQYINQ